jgi:hypothetical protein
MPRSRKDSDPPTPPAEPAPLGPPPRPLRRWLIQGLLPLLAGAVLMASIVLVGARTREHLRARGRYCIAFADIGCAPPAGLSRDEFLGEVQYLAGLPDQLDRLDPDLPTRLARAFARHPWVGEVQRVQKTPDGLHVDLVYRRPVLAVPLGDTHRAVDHRGVLLPLSAQQARLPRLVGLVAQPAGPPGTPWGDPRVEAAAQTVGYLRPHLERLRLTGCMVEVPEDGVILSKGRRRVRWGRQPGDEAPDEPAAKVKLRRLLEAKKGDDLDLGQP